MWAYLSRSRPLTLMSWRLSASAPGCEARLPLVPVWVLGEWRLGPGLLLAGGGAIEAREAPGDGEEADPDQSLEPELELEFHSLNRIIATTLLPWWLHFFQYVFFP